MYCRAFGVPAKSVTLWGKEEQSNRAEVFGEIRKRSMYCLCSDVASIGFVMPTKPAANAESGCRPCNPDYTKKGLKIYETKNNCNQYPCDRNGEKKNGICR